MSDRQTGETGETGGTRGCKRTSAGLMAGREEAQRRNETAMKHSDPRRQTESNSCFLFFVGGDQFDG